MIDGVGIMNSIKLQVDSEFYKCNLEFNRRINIIRGDSGVGKTYLVDLIQGDIIGVTIDATYPVVILQEDTWLITITNMKDSILIADDFSVLSDKRFAGIMKYLVENNLWLISICREELEPKDALNKLPISTQAMFRLTTQDGITRYLEPIYKSDYATKYTICVCEDSGRGYDFYNRISDIEVQAASCGKDSIYKDIELLCKKHRNILILLDTASFGFNIFKILGLIGLNQQTHKITLIDDYECFEEVVVRSNFFKDNKELGNELENLFVYANRYNSWENYFEYAANKYCDNIQPRYHKGKHSVLSDCYYKECTECNDFKREKCEFELENPKIKSLLIGTKFEKFLTLLKTQSDDLEKSNVF